MSTAIVWFRQDLRLADNPALHAAIEQCEQIVPVFIDEASGNSGLLPKESSASHVWLHHALNNLQQRLLEKGVTLIFRRGDALECLQQLQQETGATHLYWNRRYDPVGIRCDTEIKQQLSEVCEVRSFNGSLLSEPWAVLKKDGTPYKVFTAFWKMKRQLGFPELPLAEPLVINEQIPLVPPFTKGDALQPPLVFAEGHSPLKKGRRRGFKASATLSLDDFGYLPKIRWDKTMMEAWETGELTAHDALENFLNEQVPDYKAKRDFPASPATSQLSPHLHFGTISPRQILNRAEAFLAENPGAETGVQCFLSEVGWREFAYYLLYHFPATTSESLDKRFTAFPWRDPEEYQTDLIRWQQGQTGFPLIDAGMRQLWATGWMHNRVRMIVASFLTKNLLIPWQEGESWFRDTLVDADLASNTMGWQWVAGCGADAAPYFRIFNPVLQSEKFDASGDYIRKWVPELRGITDKTIHQPWKREDEIDYPDPITDLKASRQRALEQFGIIKNAR
uniref:Deoxyribodipyrimidine photo-lyase n=1 Tax=uncultured Thiotrichaceae bacterium TaxID=298394 RepID=A0A6S6UD36_9GAMM|nr:MAG: Deoxyribodipyrimidine photolyase (EC [uncultured Thiotrichaceae bacterium]